MPDLNNLKLELKKFLPHQSICSNGSGTQEIFDLYHLGLFAAPNSFLSSLTGEPAEEGHLTYENLELVELQAEAQYHPHYHKKSAAVIYILSGVGTFILGNKHIEYSSCERIVIPAGVMHGFKTRTLTLFLSIQSPPILDPHTQYIDLHYMLSSHEEK